MPVSQVHDRRETWRLASNHHCILRPARLPSHRFRRPWLEGDRERPDECGYQRQMIEQGAPPCCEFRAGPILEAVRFGPEAIPTAIDPEFRQHDQNEDE